MQEVSLGRTQSGRPGLFTGGFMAMPLSEDEHARMQADPAYYRAKCARWGFKPL